MRTTPHRLWLLIAVLATSCATAEKFAKRSELELRQGDPDEAYRTAVLAIRREPHNARALAALSAAAQARASEWKQRVHRVAEVDTLGAARQALEFEGFRREVARCGGDLPPDVEYASYERVIRAAAAGILYDEADGELKSGRAKDAYVHFRAAHDYAPGFRDLERRIDDAYQRAVQRVAVLPVENQTGVPDLGRALADRIWDGVQQRVGSENLEFTRLIGPAQVYDRMTVSELGELSREQAICLGRRIGADRVVWGRVFGSHTETNTDRFLDTIFRRRAVRDTSGKSRVVFEPHEFSAVRRSRQVSVSWEVDVLDVNEEASVAHRANTVDAFARTVYTSFRPEGDCDDYCLVPPDFKSSDPDRCQRVERDWGETFGTWTVPHLLDASRRDSGRGSRLADVRAQFHRDTRNLPVFLDDLPDEGELMLIALEDLWRPALDVLKEQDDR